MVTFLRVAELSSFSAAAAQLGITTSTASRQVTRLEKELGVQLMQRTTRHLRLTAAGLEALARCGELVTAAQGTMQIAQTYNGEPRGQVRISAPKAFARRVLHPLLLTFLQRYPEVDVQLIVADRDIDPIREEVDLVVRLTQHPPEGLAARPLVRVQQVLCATPHYLAQHTAITHPQDLMAHSCLSLGEQPNDHHWRFRKAGQASKTDPSTKDNEVAQVVVRGRYVANHSEVRLDAVLAHLGVGCLPNFTADEALQRGAVVRVLPDWEFQANYHGTAYVLYPPSRFLPPKCRVLIDHLADALRQKSAS
ncbi:MAG: LysR family transcriptional regulator [Polaromonas sp.]|nr:LysR family transcriptional regulator [Polaromonas sp.]